MYGLEAPCLRQETICCKHHQTEIVLQVKTCKLACKEMGKARGARMTVLAVRGAGSFSVLGMAEMPMWASPFLSLALTSVVVPRASFLGHLAGIVAGFAVRS